MKWTQICAGRALADDSLNRISNDKKQKTVFHNLFNGLQSTFNLKSRKSKFRCKWSVGFRTFGHLSCISQLLRVCQTRLYSEMHSVADLFFFVSVRRQFNITSILLVYWVLATSDFYSCVYLYQIAEESTVQMRAPWLCFHGGNEFEKKKEREEPQRIETSTKINRNRRKAS